MGNLLSLSLSPLFLSVFSPLLSSPLFYVILHFLLSDWRSLVPAQPGDQEHAGNGQPGVQHVHAHDAAEPTAKTGSTHLHTHKHKHTHTHT